MDGENYTNDHHHNMNIYQVIYLYHWWCHPPAVTPSQTTWWNLRRGTDRSTEVKVVVFKSNVAMVWAPGLTQNKMFFEGKQRVGT